MIADIGVAKINKKGSAYGGDTVELIERPRGGISVILADGQGSGRAAKITSGLVVRKAVSLIADGARDGAVARAANDYLYSMKGGKVSSTLAIISCDLDSRSLVITRNSNTPAVFIQESEILIWDEPVPILGTRMSARPEVRQLPLEPGYTVITFSDGIFHAGHQAFGRNLESEVAEILARGQSAAAFARSILDRAVELDGNQPHDDMTVVVVKLTTAMVKPLIRTLSATLPL